MTKFVRKKRTLVEISQIIGPLTLFSVPLESPWWIGLHQGDFIMTDLWCGSYWNSNILCVNIEYTFYKTAFQAKWTYTHIHILWRTRLQYVLYEGQIPTNYQSGYICIYSFTSQFSKFSKKQFWYITTVLNFFKVKEHARETSIYKAR